MKREIMNSAAILMIAAASCAFCLGGCKNETDDDTTTSSGTTSGTVYTLSSGTDSQTSQTYSSTTSDENAVKVSGGTATLTSCTITKSGDTSNSDNSSFYGTNAAVLSTGGTLTLSGGTITTAAKGANAIVAYGGTVIVSDMTMTTTENLSRGIHATGGGKITATNCTITTGNSGNASNCSVIASDKGGGTVTVTGGTYTTTGSDSAVIYSTGTITVNSITGSSSQGEIGVIEGSNYIYINSSTISSGASSSKRGLQILQSGSGDASGYDGYIYATDSTLTLTSDAPFIEICTSVTGTVTLENCTLTIPSETLMLVDYNTRWTTTSPIANLILNKSSTTSANNEYTGNVVVDTSSESGYSTATVTVADGVTWNGAYDNGNYGKSTTAVINGTWTLTGDSYVDTVTIGSTGIINTGSYTLHYGTLTNNGTLNGTSSAS